jgi:cytochrome c oxidase subunit II
MRLGGLPGEPAPASALEPAGPQADELARLWDVFLWVSVAVTVLVVAFAAAAVIRSFRRRRREEDPLAIDPAQERRMVRVIAAATALTVAVLFALLVVSVRSGSALASLATDGALSIEITGHQWWWQIDYGADQPSERASTANELHLPVGRPVLLRLRSSDVIHSFWVPNLHGKKDLVPGRENRTWIQVDRPGLYRGQCAEFCGLQHARMAITVVAQPAAEFDAWLAAQRSPAPPPATAAARRGREVFMSGTCVMCHAIAGTDAGATVGPDLSHVAGRANLAAGTLPRTRRHLAGWILDPQRIKPGVLMPANPMSPADLSALLAYLETLR